MTQLCVYAQMQGRRGQKAGDIQSESVILLAQTISQAEHGQNEKAWKTFPTRLQYRKIDKAETEVLANLWEARGAI